MWRTLFRNRSVSYTHLDVSKRQLYGCGLRVSELVGLDLDRVRFDEGTLRVLGKGSKERLVPFSGLAIERVRVYLQDSRPYLTCSKAHPSPALFLNARGGRLSRQSVHKVVEKAGLRIGIKNLHPHTCLLYTSRCV